MPENDLRLLVEAAQEAGDIATSYWQKSPQTWEKSGNGGPVTEADLAVDRHLRQKLSAARSDYGWLSEETEDTGGRLKRERVFIVDPIDGTRSFLAGEKTWAHSLAIAENGLVVAGAVYLPALGLLYSATTDGGAFLNDEPLQVSRAEKAESSRVLSARPGVAPELWGGQTPPFERHFRPSLAYRLALVAEGRFDAMLSFRKTWEWDIAAGSLIAAEAGARVLDSRERPMRFNSPEARQDGIVAASAALSQDMFRRLTLP